MIDLPFNSDTSSVSPKEEVKKCEIYQDLDLRRSSSDTKQT